MIANLVRVRIVKVNSAAIVRVLVQRLNEKVGRYGSIESWKQSVHVPRRGVIVRNGNVGTSSARVYAQMCENGRQTPARTFIPIHSLPTLRSGSRIFSRRNRSYSEFSRQPDPLFNRNPQTSELSSTRNPSSTRTTRRRDSTVATETAELPCDSRHSGERTSSAAYCHFPRDSPGRDERL